MTGIVKRKVSKPTDNNFSILFPLVLGKAFFSGDWQT
jgi:hypothetical protein